MRGDHGDIRGTPPPAPSSTIAPLAGRTHPDPACGFLTGRGSLTGQRSAIGPVPRRVDHRLLDRQNVHVPRLTAPVVEVGTMRGRTQPVLRAGWLLLRPWESRDAPAVVDAYSDPAIQRWNLQVLDPKEATAWVEHWEVSWQSESDACWAAVDPSESGMILGRVALRDIDLSAGIGQITYWVLPAARGRGIAAAATEAVVRWALDDLGLHRLELHHSIQNPASCRVAEKSGFQLEGTARSALLHADGWHDMHLHARVADDALSAAAHGR